jgi:hypothetical protein
VRYIPLTIFLLLWCLHGQAQTSMECERYQITGSLKTDSSLHRFELDKSKSTISYRKISGQSWLAPSPTTFPAVWSTPDGLRAVATYVASPHPKQSLVGPVYVVDLDFSTPRVRMESFGGVIDFSEVVSSPWKIECRRLN